MYNAILFPMLLRIVIIDGCSSTVLGMLTGLGPMLGRRLISWTTLQFRQLNRFVVMGGMLLGTLTWSLVTSVCRSLSVVCGLLLNSLVQWVR